MSRSKRFGLVFTLAALGLAISAHPAQGQTMSFFRQFTTPWMDRAVAVAADASGIYVAGNKPGPGGPVSAGLRKYDSRGNEVWTREFSDPAGGNVTLYKTTTDSTGVYVIGTQVVRRLVQEMSKGNDAREVPIYDGKVDYDRLVKDIFEAEKVICWW